MRRSKLSHSLVAGVLVLAMAASITGLMGAPGVTINLVSPKAGARVSGVVDIQASIRASADITYVLFGVDGDRPYSTNSAPYIFELDTRTLADGAHRIFVEAYDRYGMVGSSKTITIYVRNGSAAVAQAQKPTATRLAAAPSADSATRVAAERATEPKRDTAAVSGESRTAAPAGPAAGRGPLPEPVHTAVQPQVPPMRPTGPAGLATASAPSAAVSDLPPAPRRLADRTRGHTVVLNGRPVECDVATDIVKGRMRVGFRAIFERLGAAVSWIPETRTAKSVQPAMEVEVSIGQRLARVNGREVDIGMPAFIREGRTTIPLRFFANATGSALHWDGTTRIATVGAKAIAIADRSSVD